MEERNYSMSMEEYGDTTEEMTLIAMEMMKDEKEVNKVLDKVSGICRRLKGIPVIGEIVEEILTMADMMRSYIHKEYTQIPMASLLSCLAGLVYLVAPLDVLPDCTPLVGYLDDMQMLRMVLRAVQVDLQQYRQWKDAMSCQKIMRYYEMR